MAKIPPGARIAVTGVTGFVGKSMVECLANCGYSVVGISQVEETPPHLGGMLESYHAVDLARSWPGLEELDGIVHLAGLSAVGPSFDRPLEYINTNGAMVTNMLEHALRVQWQGRVIIVSSGSVYRAAEHYQRGLSEDSTLLATSPYVVSKMLVECQAEYYRLRGVDAVVVRPFNHIGPGQHAGFIVPDLAEKVLAHQPGTVIPVGNLESARDYTDVRDIVEAYKLLLEYPQPSHLIYNVCSGISRTGREVLAAVCNALGLPIPPVEMKDLRAIDPSAISGSAKRIIEEIGWMPRIDFETSVSDYIRYRMNERTG